MKDKLTIVVDTREKLEYEFSDHQIQTVRRALPAGDYSLAGYETMVAVERKTLNDFVRSVTKDRKRFFKELKKLSGYEAACIVVEADLQDVLTRKYRSAAHPNSVFGTIVSIVVDLQVPVFFCSSRPMARKFTQSFLTHWTRKLK